MWRKVGLAFLVLAGLLIVDTLSGKSDDSPSDIVEQLVTFSFAAAILVGIVSAWKWLTRLLKQPGKTSGDLRGGRKHDHI